MRWPVLAAILAALPLAGCASDGANGGADAPLGVLVDAAGLASDSYYSFSHGGGGLDFSLDGNGSAELELFDGLDQRLGSVEFGTEEGNAANYAVVGVPAGRPVLHVVSLTGTLRVESAGQPVEEFQPLPVAVERLVLVSRAAPMMPSTSPLIGGDSIDEVVPVPLQRAPSELRVLASGQYNDLVVTVNSARGPVLEVSARSTQLWGPQTYFGSGFENLGGIVRAENFSDGQFEARVQAADLSGALVIESVTYSRAELPLISSARAAKETPAFTYGALVDGAAAFQVHTDARSLYLWQEAPLAGNGSEAPEPIAAAWIALYDPDDYKLGVVRVVANETVRIPITRGGDYVAVPLSGSAMLGSDVVPADFQIHPLAHDDVVVPSAAAGADGRYDIARAEVQPAGIPFQVETTMRGPGSGGFATPGFTGCSAGGHVRLDVDGETILLAGDHETADLQASLRVATTGLTVSWDGFGDDACQHPAIRITGYVRQPLG